MEMNQLLKRAADLRCSDVHLSVGRPPLGRLHGVIRPLDPALMPLEQGELRRMIISVLTESQRAQLERDLDIDCAISVPGVARFRASVFHTSLGLEIAMRIVPDKVPEPDAIGLTPAMIQLSSLNRGLVLVTGQTGAGKTTTLACLIEQANRSRNEHILTIEDPIEYLYESKRCIIRQREVGRHARGFPQALRAALREDPDIILIGEMRDPETISLAVTAAETGHLCLSTLHTRDAASTVSRIIDSFPPHQQGQIRIQLAGSLRAILAQVLLPRKDGRGRFAARELLLVNPAIATHIREGKVHLIPAAIETGVAQGMIMMDRSIGEALKAGIIDPEVAYSNAPNPDVMLQIARGARR